MITVTDNAVRQLRALLESRPEAEHKGLRVGIAKGGCSGLQYEMSLGARKPGDEIVVRDGVEFFRSIHIQNVLNFGGSQTSQLASLNCTFGNINRSDIQFSFVLQIQTVISDDFLKR